MFAAIAIPAGETQVVQYVVPHGVNVINLHRLPTVCFTGLAVFATAMGAFIDNLPEGVPRHFTHA
jgi:hypothetical protein